MRIYIVRHAEKEKEGENPSLTKKGIKQANYLAKELRKVKFDKFYSSDMNRTKQTSEIISKKIKMKPLIENSLNEYETADLKKPIMKWSLIEKNRLKKMILFFDRLTKNPKKEENILIVAHGITNRIVLSHLTKISMKQTVPFVQNETGVNIFEWSEKWKNWRTVKWNDNSHLPRNLK